MIKVNNERERILEGDNNGLIWGGLLSWNLLRGPEVNHENPQDTCCHGRDANRSFTEEIQNYH